MQFLTGTGLEGSWNEDVLKKILNQRKIRLTVFIHNRTAGKCTSENKDYFSHILSFLWFVYEISAMPCGCHQCISLCLLPFASIKGKDTL